MKSLFSKPIPVLTPPIDLSRALKPPARIIPVVQRPARSGNHRTAPRKETWCVCSLYSERDLIREAVIMDISHTGARLRFRARGALPRYVRIKASRIGLNRLARVVWQDSYNAGLQFVASAQRAASSTTDGPIEPSQAQQGASPK